MPLNPKPCPLCKSTELILIPCYCHQCNGQITKIACKCGLVFSPPGSSTTAETISQWDARPLDIDQLQPSRN